MSEGMNQRIQELLQLAHEIGSEERDLAILGEGNASVTNDLLAEWNTSGLSGLYAVQLQVVRSDQRVDSAVIQVTVK